MHDECRTQNDAAPAEAKLQIAIALQGFQGPDLHRLEIAIQAHGSRTVPSPVITTQSGVACSRPDRGDTYMHVTAALDIARSSSSASNLTINYRVPG